LKVWFTTWIEREEHANTSLRGIEIGNGSSRRLSLENSGLPTMRPEPADHMAWNWLSRG